MDLLQNIKALETAGLSNNETKVYLALLELGSASVVEIAKRSGVHRVNIYDVLERLMRRGLVSAVLKANKRYYEAASPENLREVIKERQTEMEEVGKAIPRLVEMFKATKKKQEVHSYKGKQGIISIYEEMLAETEAGDCWYGIGVTGTMRDVLKYWIDDFTERKAKKGVSMKSLYYITAKKEKRKKFKLQERRYMPESVGYVPVSTYIYGGDKVAIICFDSMIGVVIQDAATAEAYRRYFDWMWERSKDF